MGSSNPTAFVTVIEPGYLEDQASLMCESIRKWGGRLADAPILCFSPRHCGRLSPALLRKFDELGVRYSRERIPFRYSWYAFANKALAMSLAKQSSDADNLVWIDADTLIVDEPSEFLRTDTDFSAIFTKGDITSTGPDHAQYPYWKAVCDLFGIRVEDLPYVQAEGARVMFAIQAGIFRVRRASPIVEHYLRNIELLMDSRIRPSITVSPYWAETVSLTLAPFTSGSTWSELPRSHNLVISGYKHADDISGFDAAKVIHYHAAFASPDTRASLIDYFREFRPHQSAWIERTGLINDASLSLQGRLYRRCLATYRQRYIREYETTSRSC